MSCDFQKRLAIDHTKVVGEGLKGFPVLVVLQDDALKGAEKDMCFLTADGATRLPHEILQHDSAQGVLRAWVKVPELSTTADTIIQVRCGGGQDGLPADTADVWDEDYRLVVHSAGAASPQDSSLGRHDVSAEKAPDGGRWVRVPHTEGLIVDEAITVETWVNCIETRAEAVQSLVSKWASRTSLDAFDAFDAGNTGGMDTGGFFGAVFDGRYVYFSPQHDKETRHGKVLRYDTHGDFKDPASWRAYDAGQTNGMTTKGYYGVVYDGRYVYFPPRREPAGFHSRVLRYDTRGEFTAPGSWEAYDVGAANSSQSAAFDGRYIYFCPGQESRKKTAEEQALSDGPPTVTGMRADEVVVASSRVMRYDTQGNFKDANSWATYDANGTSGLDTRDFDGAVFDGRYIYFAPLSYGAVLRYDTQSDFQDKAGWVAYDGAKLNLKRCVGAVFDGRYVYFVPYGECDVAVRHDTRGDFEDDASWSAYPYRNTAGLNTQGYDGAFFDGRYVYYIPYWDEAKHFHGVVLRYDTQGEFTDPASWDCTDASLTDGLETGGFNGGATDGRYLYFAAWMDGKEFPERIIGNGRVLRCDTVGDRGAFRLRYCDLGHNGGLCAAVPGARFIVNTDKGPRSVAANRGPELGRHHLVGTYDGNVLRLYIDGQLVNEQAASGRIVRNDVDVAIGRVLNGLGQFRGSIEEVRISTCARTSDWIRTAYNNLSNPEQFCQTA